MDRMKRFIDISVPVQTCNLQCGYCYIAQNDLFLQALPYFHYDAKTIRRALSKERLGGICHLNLCGGGETLLPPQMTEIVEELLAEGHYVAIVTNGTVTKRFDEICSFDAEYLERVLFKFSLHYLELKRLGLFDVFWSNVDKVRKAGCSISVEVMPCDELIPYIDEIKKMCMQKVGAMPHVTVARNERDLRLPILTEHSIDEYQKIWGTFDSALFDFKMSTFYKRRQEFCYAGSWSATLNLGTGILRQCYCGKAIQNIFENVDKPIKWQPVGNNCNEPHCHNAHVWLTLGDIPSLDTPSYALMRDRVGITGEHWLQARMRAFLSEKLETENCILSKEEEERQNKRMRRGLRMRMLLLTAGRKLRKKLPKSLRVKLSNRFRKF